MKVDFEVTRFMNTAACMHQRFQELEQLLERVPAHVRSRYRYEKSTGSFTHLQLRLLDRLIRSVNAYQAAPTEANLQAAEMMAKLYREILLTNHRLVLSASTL